MNIPNEEFLEALDKAEKLGYQRGVKTVFINLFSKMEKDKMMMISFMTLKKIWEEFEKNES